MINKEPIINIYPRTYEEVKEKGLRDFRIFKPIEELDAEIRTISEEISEERKEVYFSVKVGYYESLGEMGLINTFFYDVVPTKEELIKDIKEDLLNDLEKYKDRMITGREEIYLNILGRLNLKWTKKKKLNNYTKKARLRS